MLKKRLNIMEDGNPCDCGCNETVADDPIKMLKFLAGRLRHAGVSECVGSGYADDIEQILEGGYITLSITEYEQLQADKKRLDWLADNYYSCTMDSFDKMFHPNRIAWRFYGMPNAQGDVRYVLDQAIAKDKP